VPPQEEGSVLWLGGAGTGGNKIRDDFEAKLELGVGVLADAALDVGGASITRMMREAGSVSSLSSVGFRGGGRKS
jgi:hypothetical protein